MQYPWFKHLLWVFHVFFLTCIFHHVYSNSHSNGLNTSMGNAHFSTEDEIALQNLSTQVCVKAIYALCKNIFISILSYFFFYIQMVPLRSEDRSPNENIYSEPLERTESCRKAQSRCSFGDQDNEMNIYSYNHLHEKPIQTCDDVYDVANPIFQSSAHSD